ncbi:MAG: UDP-N-acetylmuramoyl-tripeptide--D-alanyl-D-alanine ligase, partial [Planctomycetota bacterium]
MSGFFTPESIRTHTGGTFLARAEQARECHGVSIDTRELAPGQLFVALPGERTDGHDHLQKAADAGATIALVERDVEAPAGMTLAKVDSCRTALARLASAYRTTLRSTRVVGVTGSNGKTTTVRLLDHVLGSALRGSASRKSFNNELGLPLTILNARPTDQYLVCEIGMSNPGEIRKLAAIARPDVGVVTSIGRAHLESFGTVAGIAKEKASLLFELAESGIGIVTADSDELEPSLPPGVPMIRFGERDTADLRLTSVEHSREGVRFQLNDRAWFEVPLVGAHNAWNAAATVAVARRLGLSDGQIAESLRTAAGAAMRLDRRTVAGIEIVN